MIQPSMRVKVTEIYFSADSTAGRLSIVTGQTGLTYPHGDHFKSLATDRASIAGFILTEFEGRAIHSVNIELHFLPSTSTSLSSITLSATLHISTPNERDIFRLYGPKTITFRRLPSKQSPADSLDADITPDLDGILHDILADLLAYSTSLQEEPNEPNAYQDPA